VYFERRMNMTRSEAHMNLERVLGMLHKQNAEPCLIESVEVARNAILAIELMGIAASEKNK
jgi:hypothetical protein